MSGSPLSATRNPSRANGSSSTTSVVIITASRGGIVADAMERNGERDHDAGVRRPPILQTLRRAVQVLKSAACVVQTDAHRGRGGSRCGNALWRHGVVHLQHE